MKRAIALLLVGMPACFPWEGPRTYPEWTRLQPQPSLAGCLRVDGWVAKSGKQGLGLTIEASTPNEACVFSIHAAELDVGGERVPARPLPSPATLHRGQMVWVYLPFAFDGDRAWNDGRRTANVRLSLEGGALVWELQDVMADRKDCEERRP